MHAENMCSCTRSFDVVEVLTSTIRQCNSKSQAESSCTIKNPMDQSLDKLKIHGRDRYFARGPLSDLPKTTRALCVTLGRKD